VKSKIDSEGKSNHIFLMVNIINFFRGVYQKLIVGELERNYIQIKDMHTKLQNEEKEDQFLAEKLS